MALDGTRILGNPVRPAGDGRRTTSDRRQVMASVSVGVAMSMDMGMGMGNGIGVGCREMRSTASRDH